MEELISGLSVDEQHWHGVTLGDLGGPNPPGGRPAALAKDAFYHH